ncbi:hypothetical protein [Burkholderia cenocepacia]|uniref:hypothetical protein n=1 Tax=Burkholderia cenocepacia TaxID=95486 RepID=UPI000F59A740|nr:hypothetical protein [Burkholderia cenocepacia]
MITMPTIDSDFIITVTFFCFGVCFIALMGRTVVAHLLRSRRMVLAHLIRSKEKDSKNTESGDSDQC